MIKIPKLCAFNYHPTLPHVGYSFVINNKITVKAVFSSGKYKKILNLVEFFGFPEAFWGTSVPQGL